MSVSPTPAVIETKVFIHGCDATQMTDDEIFRHIANIEAEIDKLDKIKKKPKKLEAKIVQMGEDIKKLVEYVDSRN